MLLADETLTVAIVAAASSLLGTVFTGLVALLVAWLALLQARAAVQVAHAAIAVGEVKATLTASTAATDAKLAEIAKTGESIHTLVNSAMGAQLRLHAETARAKANITRDAGDEAVADLAEKMLGEHMQKQAAVDQGGGVR